MKKLFTTVSILLVLAALGLKLTEPSSKAAVPIIYWVIDPAPARGEQIHLYHMWLIRNGHCTTQTLTSANELRAFQSQPWSAAMRRAIREATPDGAAALDPGTLEEALPLVSGNVARVLGLHVDKGVLAAGRAADITLLDDDLQPRRTIVGGHSAWSAGTP